ncbi:GAF domain-containing protein, partial [Streptomyces sp. NPDC005708]|uniref:GAF domain-containing protein n=1 Tax=Streptomyces sp. NPDC005708 TaxID=3154564 RepID=UPI0033DD97A2
MPLRTLSGGADDACRRRLKLLHDAGARLGTTLDVTQTAEELAQAAVPAFADFVTVDLTEPMPDGEEPSPEGDGRVRRVAVSGVRDDFPFYPAGLQFAFHPATPQAAGLGGGPAVLAARLDDVPGWRAQDPVRALRIIGYGVHSLITVPLRVRGTVFGVATFWRSRQPAPFEVDDLSLAEELGAHAAVCIDRAHS